MKHLFVALFSLGLISSSQAQITWSQDVAPILFDHCTKCHHEGGIGPSAYMTYDDAYNDMAGIYGAISTGQMPPWPADPNYRHYAHENVLTPQEIQTIQDWVTGGGQSGDLASAPATPTYTNASELPTVDVSMQTPLYTSTATNQDIYRTFVIPSNLAADGWVDAFEIIPGNASIVHHVVVYYDPSGECVTMDNNDPGPGFQTSGTGGGLPAAAKFVAVWAPGKGVNSLPFGFAERMEAGGYYCVEVHYPAGSNGQEDQTTVNIHYTDDPTPREVWLNPILQHAPPILQQSFLYIPANQTATFNEIYTVPQDATIFSVIPHMHKVGRSIISYADLPSGETVPLISIPSWNFKWQLGYDFTQLIHLPANTQLKADAFYDNTTANPYNPYNPPQLIYAGEGTNNEMMIVFFAYTYYLPGDENIVVDPNVSVPAITERSFEWSLYPNPTNDVLTVKTFASRFENFDVRVTDVEGRIVLRERYTMPSGMQQHNLDVSELPSGIYCISLVGATQQYTQRFVVN
jgi:Secretion system C-terminal sorting domain